MMNTKYYEFPNCMHILSAAMHMQNVDPHKVTISLPREAWWALWCALERKFRNVMVFDGRGHQPDRFMYMGFTFKCNDASND